MGGFGSKSQSWEVTDDKKAAEEIPGAPTEHVGEGQVKVVAAEPLNAEVDPHIHHEGGAEEQRKSDVTTEDDPVREEASEYPHVHDDTGHAHRHLDNAEHSHHQHHDDPEVSRHHHDDEDHSPLQQDADDSPLQQDADDSPHQHDADEDHSHSHHDADEDHSHHHHHDAEYENDQNEAADKLYEDKDVEQVTSGVEHVSVHDERDEETSLVNVDIVWEYGGDTVLLVASFTEWQQFPLHSSDSVHKATFAVPRGRHTYKFIVDGEDRVDTTREHEDGYNVLHA